MTALTTPCPACNGQGVWYQSRYGGNDPDGVFKPCEACDRTGEIKLYCEGLFCDEPATELVTFPCGQSEPYCSRCAVTAREDAGMEPEPRGFW